MILAVKRENSRGNKTWIRNSPGPPTNRYTAMGLNRENGHEHKWNDLSPSKNTVGGAGKILQMPMVFRPRSGDGWSPKDHRREHRSEIADRI
jgi:hypothetical protein